MKENIKKIVVNELKGFLKKDYDFKKEEEYERAYEDLRIMFTIGSQKKYNGLWVNTINEAGK